MSWPSRIANVFRSERLIRDLDEEFESHIDEAIEHGHDPAAARRAFGSPLQHREASRDLLIAPWLDSLRSDAIFGWRQLMQRKITAAAAILSLGLAMGACTSAFRLIDALLLRPLPITNPERLYKLAYRGRGEQTAFDSLDYADFGQLRAAIKGEAELIGISSVDRMDLTWRPGAGLAAGLEKANVQYVSGWMFASFGLRPALGRLIAGSDDLEPGSHPIVLLSWDYWTRRFGRDPNVIGQSVEIGRKYGIGNDLFQIVGVLNEGFTGTEPGRMTDLFAPATMSAFVNRPEASWLKTYIRLPPGVAPAAVEERLRAAASRILEHSTTPWLKAPEAIGMEPAGGGVSGVQRDYRQALAVLGVLVALVLLIACANVANLMTAQGTARAREMALRVAIGAGRRRLVQLVLVESAMLALLAGAAGGLFTWWSTPFVVGGINPPDNPVRLSLDANWRVLAFGLAVTVAATVLFGLAPALRASAVKPALALKGGEDPHSRRRSMHALIAVQVAFSFLVLFVAGLFAGTFQRLSHQPVGFSTQRLLNIDTTSERARPPVFWDQVAERLRAVPGVETVTLADWPPLDGYSYKFNAISIDGGRRL